MKLKIGDKAVLEAMVGDEKCADYGKIVFLEKTYRIGRQDVAFYTFKDKTVFNGNCPLTQLRPLNPTEELIESYLTNKTPVLIVPSKDLGVVRWAVVVHDSEDFWLDAFATKEEAREYCVNNELPYRIFHDVQDR